MAKLSSKFMTVNVDDSGGTARDISNDVESVEIPYNYDEHDVTGFSEGSHNVITGLAAMPITINGNFNAAATTGSHTVLSGILGSTTSKTVTIDIGQGAAPTTGDPEWSGEYTLTAYTVSAGDPTGPLKFTATLNVMGSTAPSWGTKA
jgi:hypothetical protein